MRIVLAFLLAFAVAGCSPAEAGKSVEQSQQAIKTFHGELNAGNFDDIYYGSADQMQDSVDIEGFEELLGAVQKKLGKAGKSEQQSWHVNFANGTTIVTLTMQTTYDKDKATETFVYVKAKDSMKLAGYNIQSRALIVN